MMVRRSTHRIWQRLETLHFPKPRVDPRLWRSFSQDELSEDGTLRVSVNQTKSALLAQEDTDGDGKITIDDTGPKSFTLLSLNSDVSQSREIRGTYRLSNLLQELQIAQDSGQDFAAISLKYIKEDPVDRIARRISETFWTQLTRRLDGSLIELAAKDPKDWTSRPRSRIYLPSTESEQHRYYREISLTRPEIALEVEILPDGPLTAEFIYSLNSKPGILALEMQRSPSLENQDSSSLQGSAFIVPGGRFNELYYWDSYFCCLGLLENNNTNTVAQVIDNFNFEIKHYGKILNANRSYYLGRSQPPFLTDLARRLYERTSDQPGSKGRFRRTILAAIDEYNGYWMSEPRYDPTTGLSRYRPIGKGFPPEVESGHFDHVVDRLAKDEKMTNDEFIKAYNEGSITNLELDQYLLHDRAIRESGHDTSYRLDNVAADLATIDLNCLLYKYETDIAWAIRNVFDDDFASQSSEFWNEKAKKRRQAIDKYLWNAEKGIYFDFNTATKSQTSFECVTCFYALWCGVASADQAASLVSNSLSKFEQLGGLSCCTEASRGLINANRPQKQWDFPFGWAPHQMLTWEGLQRYGYEVESRRLTYRWLHMVTTVAVNFNGAIVEKYDVTQLAGSHKVKAEYGNQGLDFKGVAKEGFGWTNASYICGLTKINTSMKRALGLGVSFENYHEAKLPL